MSDINWTDVFPITTGRTLTSTTSNPPHESHFDDYYDGIATLIGWTSFGICLTIITTVFSIVMYKRGCKSKLQSQSPREFNFILNILV